MTIWTQLAGWLNGDSTMNKFKLLAASAILAVSAASASHADIVQNDDVIITFSLCVGNDCVNGESFGFDTMRLKENNLRIHFQDTSNSASFPTNDWRIVANDSTNGGANYLAIEDSDAATQPFRVDAGAGNNALIVEAGGFVGFGLDNPAVDLHVRQGNSPTLRLEQDGSSGFTPQTWDLAGNEANFFIRDVTNSSQLPFRIQPGSSNGDAIYITSAGRTVLGGTSTVSGANDRLTIRQPGTERFFGVSIVEGSAAGGDNWRLVADANSDAFFFGVQGSACGEMRIQKDGGVDLCGDLQVGVGAATGGNLGVLNDLTVGTDGTGNVTVNGTLTTATGNSCAGGCDRVFDPDYDLPTIEEHAEYMFANRHLQHVGPTDETGHINVTNHIGGMLNHLETAHIYIAQLNDRITQLEARLEEAESDEG
jgi:hypothetical protein